MALTKGLTAGDSMFNSVADLQASKSRVKTIVSTNDGINIQFYTVSVTDLGSGVLLDDGLFANPIGVASDPFGTIGGSKLDNPIAHLFKKNKVAETLNGDVSVTRSTTASRVNRSGIVRTAAIDISREEAKGRLIEDASTNLALHSEDFDNVAWTKSTSTVASNTIASPDGATTGDTITFNSGGYSSIFMALTVVSGKTHATSIFAKAGNQNFLSLEFRGSSSTPDAVFDLSTGSVVSGSGEIKLIGNGWYRCSISIISVDSSEIIIIGRGSSGSVGDTVNIWGAQLEDLSFASSYIHTTTVAVTRDEDDITFLPEDNISSVAGTIFFKVDFLGETGVDHHTISISDGTTNNRMQIIRQTGTNKIIAFAVKDGVIQWTLIGTTLAFNTEQQITLTFTKDSAKLYQDGALTASDVSVDVPSDFTIINIGKRVAGEPVSFMHINDLRIYDFVLNTEEVKYLGGL